MKLLSSLLILIATVLVAAFIYHFAEGNDDRYDVFDLLKRRPITGDILAQAKTPQSGSNPAPKLRAKPLDLNNTGILEQVNRSLADLTDAVVPSVVSIDTKTNVDVTRFVPTDPFGMFGYRQNETYESPGLGSGVIVSEDGYIVTNHHVVAGVDQISITVHDGTEFQAEWVGSDPHADIAVLRIQPTEGQQLPRFQPLAFGDSDVVRVGEMVLAVGNPFGLSETVTRGIISAKQRQISDGSNEYFQVDAVINPGNSGGPLVNIRGEIVGINVAIFTGQQGVKVWQGIGLAIPANEAREVFEAIVYGRPLIRGSLGLSLDNVTRNYAIALGLNSTKGALITNVEKGSPAEIAGLKPGDVIVKFDDKDTKDADDAYSRIRAKTESETAEITIIRKGQLMTATSTVMSKSDTNSLKLKSDITTSGQSIADALGIVVRDLKPQERQALGLRKNDPAILINDVKPGSQAERRFLPGDFIHRINRENIHSVAKFYDVLGSLPQDKASLMILSRDGHRITAVLQ